MDETDDLLRSPANAAALGESMAQYRRGEAQEHELVSAPAEVSVTEAAELLNASVTFVRELLVNGHVAGSAPDGMRVDRGSLLAYRDRDDVRRSAAADELTVLSQELGLP